MNNDAPGHRRFREVNGIAFGAPFPPNRFTRSATALELPKKIVFLDLPGVADFELMLEQSHRLMKHELEILDRERDRLSIQLFGLTRDDTLQPPDLVTPFAEWDQHFVWLRSEYTASEDDFWDAIGLDMTASEEEYLNCLDDFGRQITCAAFRLHPAASFRFRADVPLTDDQIAAAAEAWGRDLLGD